MAEQERAAGAVRRWLEGLKWDGKRRLRLGLPEALGWARRSRKTEDLVRWMAMAVRRALRPGCRAEKMFVLVGPPGMGKTRFFAALAGTAWWTDWPGALEMTRAGAEDRQRAWVIGHEDLGAATSMARGRRNLGALLAMRAEIRRKPYSRTMEEVAAHWVLCGTSNVDRLRSNETLVVCRVRTAIDVEWVARNREQLWAEVVARGTRL